MTTFGGALWAELRKVRRSKMLWLTALGFSIAPAAGGLFMVILKNPEWAMQAGIISTKARLLAGTADWPSYMSLLAQAVAGGGMAVFGLITAWIFGREYAERTAADLMALPTRRSTIVLAKFSVMAAWSAILVVWVLAVGLAVGYAVRLPPTTNAFILQQLSVTALASLMTIVLMTPFAFLASAGRGYLAPMGGLFVALVFAQFSSVMGRGEFFPWAVPILFTGAAGPDSVIGPVSVAIVALTGLTGVAATLWWWERADQIV
jgi:ABC-2 type transport system permease protein